MEYLIHHSYTVPKVHRVIKPSNVLLLDEDTVAHLSDFGIAKLMRDEDSFQQTTTLATMGYMAPVDVEDLLEGGNGRFEASIAGDLTLCEADRNFEPYEGMMFESEDAARVYYDGYAGHVGFLTRVLSSRKSERDGSIISRGLGCRGIPDIQKSGNFSNEMGQKRREGCTSMFTVKREHVGRWVVKKFVKDHNHPLVVSLPKGRPTFDEKDKKIQDLTAELRLKKRLSAAYREQLLTLIKDVENHSDHITTKVQIIRNNLKELEARSQELLDQETTSS